jgi:hypothetical protein
LSLCLIDQALCHEDIWASGGITPPFLTSALDGGELSGSCPNSFTHGETIADTHWIGRWVGPRAGLDAVEIRKGTGYVYYNNNNNRIIYDVKGPTNILNRIENICQCNDNQSYEDGYVKYTSTLNNVQRNFLLVSNIIYEGR